MISSNTRATRSRYSSPAQTHAQNQNGSWNGSLEASRSTVKESSRSFMQNWLEPSVQSKPSYEEAGLVRYGVLEGMAPLGSMPKPKKAAAENGQQPVRRIILRPSGAGGNKPAPTKQAQEETAVEQKPEKLPMSPPPPSPTRGRRKTISVIVKDADDSDYDPKGAQRRRQSGRVTATITAATKKARHSTGDATRRSSLPTARPETPKKVVRREPESRDGDFAAKVVEAAVDEALKHYRYPTAWALRTLYDEKSDDPNFVAMIEDVFSQSADDDAIAEFSKMMEQKKREGKKDNRGCYYFVPPSTNSRFTPRRPKPAPYANLLHPRTEHESEGNADQHKRRSVAHGEGRAAKKAKTSADAWQASETPRKKVSRGQGNANASASKKKMKTPTSLRKRTRRDSGSSESSLSSAMSLSSPDGDNEDTPRGKADQAATDSPSLRSGSRPSRGVGMRGRGRGKVQGGGSGGGGRGGRAGATGSASHDGPDSQPITSRRTSLVCNSNQTVSNNPESLSPTLSGRTSRAVFSSSADDTMPGRLAAAQLFPNLPTSTTKALKPAAATSGTSSGSTSSAGAGAALAMASFADDEVGKPLLRPMAAGDGDSDALWARRREAQKVTDNYRAADSAVRGTSKERDIESSGRKTRKTRQSLAAAAAAAVSTRATRSASKRPNDDVNGTVSPIALSFYGEPSSAAASRAGTPSSSLRMAKKPKTGLRVKSSPVKRKGGTAAGMPRSMSEANGPGNSGAPKDTTSDNDEDCSACGNAGDVLCCDGCPRSFHFECVDMDQAEDLPDEWYCNECIVRRFPSRVPIHKGAFGSALNNLEKSIPRAFSLPKRVQNRFEGVRAAADGDYEEIQSKTAKKRPGYDELPDFFKQREDGQAVLCHSCQKSATEIRAIIPCSVCSFHWHLDCLDPPLAVPPVLKTWRCPTHADDLLADEPRLAPAHRFRKLKGNQTITPAITRGVKNNGHIEIEWDEEEDAQGSGWPDPHSFGKTYKLPAHSVILDFIEQLRHQGAGYGSRQSEPRRVKHWLTPATDSSLPLTGSALERTMEEMQVSLNLVSLQQKRPDGIGDLAATLLAASDQNVLSLMAKGNADSIASGQLTADDKTGLRAMLAQMDAMSARIRDVLGASKQPSQQPPPALAAASSPPITEPLDANESSDMAKAIASFTEPTPPSTIDQGENTMDLD